MLHNEVSSAKDMNLWLCMDACILRIDSIYQKREKVVSKGFNRKEKTKKCFVIHFDFPLELEPCNWRRDIMAL